jgi:hypothetical protein
MSLCGMLLLWSCGDGEGKKSNVDARPPDTGPDLAGAPEAGPETSNPLEPPSSDANPRDTSSGQETSDSDQRHDTTVVPLDTGLDGGSFDGGSFDGGRLDGGSLDGSSDTKAWSIEVDYVGDAVPKRDAYVIPTDQQSCVQATGVPTCGPGMAVATIYPMTPGQLIAKAEVTTGTCNVTSCRGGCESLTVYQGQGQTAGSTCDLLVTMWDGGQREVHLALVANPSPQYACCGDPLPPNAGQWIAMNPVAFQPNPISVSSPIDGGNWDTPRFFDAPGVDAVAPSER